MRVWILEIPQCCSLWLLSFVDLLQMRIELHCCTFKPKFPQICVFACGFFCFQSDFVNAAQRKLVLVCVV